ncbi:zinc-dependent metalloprotease [Streptomyces sp. NPDC001750]|uniref:zinc-dependent metalloprotease n=1 Tax=Streptomyces sp. NPDC001750 TaxID=3364607 RepID=UPI003697C677
MTHVAVAVTDETATHGTLRHQTEHLVMQIVPLVQATTGLALPARVTFRIVTPQTWQAEHQELIRRELGQWRARQPWRDLTAAARREAVARVAFRRQAPLLRNVVPAETLRKPALLSETLLIPEGLEHAGVAADEQHLVRVLAHELVHQAQNLASAHRAFWAGSAGYGTAVTVVEEGHARWADRRITGARFGTPVSPGSARPSDHYLRVVQDTGVAQMHQELLVLQDAGCRMVEEAVRALGTDRINEVWSQRLLLPTEQEIGDPDLWVTRIKQLGTVS